LTYLKTYDTRVSVKTKLTTSEAAELAGIARVTLQRWLKAGKIPNPPKTLVGKDGRAVRLWSSADIARLRMLATETYREGQGRRSDIVAAQKKDGNR
jgi:excisionase family DNA binding protein